MRHLGGAVVLVIGSTFLAACRGEVLLDELANSQGGGGGGGAADASAGPIADGGYEVIPFAVNADGGTTCNISPGPGVIVGFAQLPSAAQIVTNGVNLYVSPYETGSVYEIDLGADYYCDHPYELNPVAANTVAVNSAWVYSVSPNGGNEAQGLVMGHEWAPDGSVFATIASGQTNVWGVAADNVNVYFTNQGPPGAVMKAPAGGGPTTTLVASGSATAIAVAGNQLVYAGSATVGGDALLMKEAVAGGTPTVLFTPSPGNSVEGLAVDADNAYFATTDGVVGRVPLAGGSITTLATGQGSGIQGIAVDGASVYWAAFETGSILKVPVGGGPATTLATGMGAVGGVTVVGGYVYFTTLGGGVFKVAK